MTERSPYESPITPVVSKRCDLVGGGLGFCPLFLSAAASPKEYLGGGTVLRHHAPPEAFSATLPPLHRGGHGISSSAGHNPAWNGLIWLCFCLC